MIRKTILILAGAILLLSCSRALEPGLYRVNSASEEGFLRIGLDSLGKDTVRYYRNSGSLEADTLLVALKAERGKVSLAFPDGRVENVTLTPYEAPDFYRFTNREPYREPSYAVDETHDLVYGRVTSGGDSGRKRVDLTMDIYCPEDGEALPRPLLVMFHDGDFLGGDKRDSVLVEWCRYFASLGYVVSSVDYRQGYRRNVEDTDDVMFKALKDANAAVRFLLKRDSLMIHSDHIFAAGAGAGAITALNLAYVRDENLPEIIEEKDDTVIVTRETLLRGFDIRAVANFWGAVADTAILHNAKIPVISFHSQDDPLVPFGEGYPYPDSGEKEEKGFFESALDIFLSIFIPDVPPFRKMYGSGIIHRILKDGGVLSELHAFEGERHNLFRRDDGTVNYPLFDEMKEQTAAFFAARMDTSPVALHQDPEDPQLFVINNAEVETCLWDVEGGVFLGMSDDTVRILMFPDAPVHAVAVSGAYSSGLTFYQRLTVAD